MSEAPAVLQIHHNGDVLLQQLAVRRALIEWVLAPLSADAHASHVDFHASRVERYAGAARGGKDATPVRVGASERCLTSGEPAIVRATCSAARSEGAPRTSISTTRRAPSPSATIASASSRQTPSSAGTNRP